jgi:hypothetical protein
MASFSVDSTHTLVVQPVKTKFSMPFFRRIASPEHSERRAEVVLHIDNDDG